jgi:hypothetical protein
MGNTIISQLRDGLDADGPVEDWRIRSEAF